MHFIHSFAITASKAAIVLDNYESPEDLADDISIAIEAVITIAMVAYFISKKR